MTAPLRQPWWMVRRPLGFAGLAGLCAVGTVFGPGPVRFAAGLVLCCYLPGRVAVGLLFHGERSPGPAVRLMFTGALALAGTMLVGLLIAAAGYRFDGLSVATGLLLLCLLLAGAWALREAGWAGTAGVGAAGPGDAGAGAVGGDGAPGPSAAVADDGPARWRRRPLGAAPVLATVPAAVLTIVLVILVVMATRYRSADSYYTELALKPADTDSAVVVVHSRERETMAFRIEQWVDGLGTSTTEFSLRPGQSREFTMASAAGRVEVRLYRSGAAAAYRRVTVRPG